MISTNLKVDVALPIYRANHWVYEAIDSVIGQTYENWRLIVVDDASSDGMLERLERSYGHLKERISFIQLQQNKRAVGARNEIIRQTNGDIVALIDQDDIWLRDKLRRQVDILENRQMYDAVHTDIEKIDAAGKLMKYAAMEENQARKNIDWQGIGNIELSRILFKGLHIRLVSSVFRRKAFEEIGGFDENTAGAEDWEFWVRFASKYNIYHLPEVLTYRRVHDSNTSSRNKFNSTLGKLKTLRIMENKHEHLNDLIPLKRTELLYGALKIAVTNAPRKEPFRLTSQVLQSEPFSPSIYWKLIPFIFRRLGPNTVFKSHGL